MRQIQITQILLLACFQVILWSCGGSKEDSYTDSISIGGNLPEEEQLLTSGFQQLTDWTAHWKLQMPDFNLGEFKLSRIDTIETIERPEENFITQGNPFFPFLKYHPEGKGTVDIYSYKITFPEEGKPYFNPDSEVTYFRSDGMRERLLFIGPSGAFEDAVWLNSEALLVVGHFESETGVSPKAWIIYPEGQLIYQYETSLTTSSYTREGFLTKRFSVEKQSNGI
ncbi:bifunctional isocitrate dehydrogenase kinase/phosphatase [Belliella kenyensis]|uniref:Bifunctional isocitrate dehydrogenase kinase/phosphatase n=1 Tax=Belliella kenyensis TaxID=1472724 RepID=A0ABV8ER90_9BACT|nr:bifunctional isocitrate dehydrogenase kinase/phosphatase [Belliella kenyensis]MCH7401960.1 bifunctional isocitrate dehydrogenase kinase/phosphatase [Belliella kenyensis]MDN3605124.1 bifunctional isocitrate dehydrogenase kinase/phosphatase [Belliella kenyensis]